MQLTDSDCGENMEKKADVFGWRGKILRADLTTGKVWDEDLPRKYMEGYIGGAGVNARLLYDLLAP